MIHSIRALDKTDRLRWEELFQNFAEFDELNIPGGGFDRVWDWIFDPENNFWCDLVVDTKGHIVGFVQYQLMHSSLSSSMVCYLSDLYVDPAQRGSGAGRLMIDHVLAFARDKGLPAVNWLTQEFNYAGRRLYDTYQSKTDFVLYRVPV